MNSKAMLGSSMLLINNLYGFLCFYADILYFVQCEFIGKYRMSASALARQTKAMEQAARRFLSTYRKGANPRQDIDIDHGVP